MGECRHPPPPRRGHPGCRRCVKLPGIAESTGDTCTFFDTSPLQSLSPGHVIALYLPQWVCYTVEYAVFKLLNGSNYKSSYIYIPIDNRQFKKVFGYKLITVKRDESGQQGE